VLVAGVVTAGAVGVGVPVTWGDVGSGPGSVGGCCGPGELVVAPVGVPLPGMLPVFTAGAVIDGSVDNEPIAALESGSASPQATAVRPTNAAHAMSAD
jgi:hypothetical protein